MKKSKLFTAFGAMLLCLGHTMYARENHFFQVIKVDSIPSNIIPRVTIYVKDLSADTALPRAMVILNKRRYYTDNNGSVTIDSVNRAWVVNVSRIGYLTQEKKIQPELTIRLTKQERDVALADFTNGLYQRPLEHSTASFTVIDGAELRKVNAMSFTTVLKYFVPSFIIEENNDFGSDPNTPPSVKIRSSYNFPTTATIAAHTGIANTGVQINPSTGDFAAGNIYNPNQPVIILNGVQVALQSVLDLDINRIERIVVLKDAAATAAYGARGGNGVVLIQTLRPKAGTMNITYSGQLQITSPDLSSYHLPNADQKLALEKAAGLYNNNDALYQSRLNQVKNGTNTNWLKIPTRTGIGHRHYLSIEGGDLDVSYGADVSYNDIEGVMKGSNRRNVNLGGYLNVHIGNVFLTNSLAVTKSTATNSPYGSFDNYTKQNGYWDPYDPVSGSFKKLLDMNTVPDTLRFFNPAWNSTLSTTNTNDYIRLSDNLSAIWNIGYGFKLNGRMSLSRQSDEVNVFLSPGNTVFGNYSPDDFFKRGKYNQTTSEFLSAEGNLNLDYTKKINRHVFYVSSGVMAQQTNSSSAGVELVGFTTDKLADLSFGNAYSNTRPSTGKIITRLVSGYGNVTYSFDDRYQIEGTLNNDVASQFARNNPTAIHWSAGASWNLHREHFFRPNKIITTLSIYGNMGTTGHLFYQSYLGNTSFNYFTDRQYISSGSGGLTTRGVGLGAYLTAYGNNDLKAPETQKQNIGIDAALLQNRVFIIVNAFRNKTTNLILPVASPVYTGFLNYNYYDNGGGIENKGLEFDLSVQVIRNTKKKVFWTVRVNGIHNEERITAVTDYLQTLNGINDAATTDQTKPQPRYVTGESLTGIWAVRSLGIDATTGREKFVKADGTETFTWDAADKILAGDYAPQWQGSFGTSVTVKNWSADVYCFYQYGASYYNQTLADKVENANLNYNVDNRALNNRWQQPGDNAIYKPVSVNGSVTNPTYATTRFVEKNNYISNAVLALRYSLPGSVAARLKAKHMAMGLTGNNLFRQGGMTAERGIWYPFNRTYTFSLTTSF